VERGVPRRDNVNNVGPEQIIVLRNVFNRSRTKIVTDGEMKTFVSYSLDAPNTRAPLNAQDFAVLAHNVVFTVKIRFVERYHRTTVPCTIPTRKTFRPLWCICACALIF
jgi:hypothetical protein